MTTIINQLYSNLKKPIDTEVIEKNIERILSKNIDKRATSSQIPRLKK